MKIKHLHNPTGYDKIPLMENFDVCPDCANKMVDWIIEQKRPKDNLTREMMKLEARRKEENEKEIFWVVTYMDDGIKDLKVTVWTNKHNAKKNILTV